MTMRRLQHVARAGGIAPNWMYSSITAATCITASSASCRSMTPRSCAGARVLASCSLPHQQLHEVVEPAGGLGVFIATGDTVGAARLRPVHASFERLHGGPADRERHCWA